MYGADPADAWNIAVERRSTSRSKPLLVAYLYVEEGGIVIGWGGSRTAEDFFVTVNPEYVRSF
ncbi:MAG: hypothetical protein WCN98_11825 [Verrucomicrobiaceae bacterium]